MSDESRRGLHEAGGTVGNTLKGGGTKKGWGNKDFKRGASWVKGLVP